jgi:phosphatidylserine synthase
MRSRNSGLTSRFLVAQVLTATRVALADAAIMFTLAGQSVIAAKLITVGVLTDILDGPIAARLGMTTDFGALFDYFADYLCYIVAPVILSRTFFTGITVSYALLITLPLLTGALRYARNAGLLKQESFGQLGFPGLGTVFYALFIVGIVLVDFERLLGSARLKLVLCLAVPIFSFLMVLRVRYPKLTTSKVISGLVLLFLVVLPFAFTKGLAGCMLFVVLAYTTISPFLMNRQRVKESVRAPAA